MAPPVKPDSPVRIRDARLIAQSSREKAGGQSGPSNDGIVVTRVGEPITLIVPLLNPSVASVLFFVTAYDKDLATRVLKSRAMIKGVDCYRMKDNGELYTAASAVKAIDADVPHYKFLARGEQYRSAEKTLAFAAIFGTSTLEQDSKGFRFFLNTSLLILNGEVLTYKAEVKILPRSEQLPATDDFPEFVMPMRCALRKQLDGFLGLTKARKRPLAGPVAANEPVAGPSKANNEQPAAKKARISAPSLANVAGTEDEAARDQRIYDRLVATFGARLEGNEAKIKQVDDNRKKDREDVEAMIKQVDDARKKDREDVEKKIDQDIGAKMENNFKLLFDRMDNQDRERAAGGAAAGPAAGASGGPTRVIFVGDEPASMRDLNPQRREKKQKTGNKRHSS